VKKILAGRRTVEISHEQKILYPKDKLTKLDVAQYYKDIAPVMLPHIKDRPISMRRFPNGIKGKNFFQKGVPDYFPNWVRTASILVKERKTRQKQVMVQDVATLVYLANQANLEFHIWLSRYDKINRPDKLVFDLDPSKKQSFGELVEAALILKEYLEDDGLFPFVMTSGSKGLHVVVPLRRTVFFDESREYARGIVREIVQSYPKKYTDQARKFSRRGRIFIDYLRNAYAQTSVAPYSLRALPGAPVATPLDWKELKNKKLHAQSYTIKNIFQRLSKKDDPWKNFRKKSRSLPQ
jgi:bifunctional non-homologous end joining protein LigD